MTEHADMANEPLGSSASPAVGRGLDILLCVASHPGPVRVSTLIRELAIPRSSLYHILKVLVDRGFLVYLQAEQAYGMGLASFEIGSAYLRHRPLEAVARVELLRVATRLNQIVHLGILHGTETVYLLKERPDNTAAAVTLVTEVGVRLPGHLTANGRAILANMPSAQVRALFPSPEVFINRTGHGPESLTDLREVLRQDRQRGWSEEIDMITDGYQSVASCIFDYNSYPVAALSTTWRRGHGEHPAADCATALRTAANQITRALAGRPPTETLKPL